MKASGSAVARKRSLARPEPAQFSAAGTVALLTAASRVLGFVRDVVMARLLGLGPIADAFFVAWTLPNLFRRVFGEGALAQAFVPVFVEAHEKEREVEASRLASAAITRLVLVLTAIVLVLEGGAFGLRAAIAHTEAGDPILGLEALAPAALERADLVLALSQVLLPYLVLVCASALLAGGLNGLGHFVVPAAGPCIVNLVWIGALLAGSRLGLAPETKVFALAWALTLGGVVQLATGLVATERMGLRVRPLLAADPAKLAKIRALFGATALGLAAVQISTLVDSALAWFAVEGGGVSALFYANRLVQLPVGVVGVAVATAVFPELSRLAARGERERLDETADAASGLAFFVALPCAAVLAALAEPIVAVLFERGAFGPESTVRTAVALRAYAGAVAAACVQPVLTRVFFAEGNARATVVAAVRSGVVAKLALSLLLVGPFAESGLAWATTFSQVAVLAELYVLQARARRARGAAAGLSRLAKPLLRASVLALALAVTARAVHAAVAPAVGGVAGRALALAIALGAGSAAWLALAWIVRAPELEPLLGALARKLRRR
jgi:putative peptidoglycan lipid II flippase